MKYLSHSRTFERVLGLLCQNCIFQTRLSRDVSSGTLRAMSRHYYFTVDAFGILYKKSDNLDELFELMKRQ